MKNSLKNEVCLIFDWKLFYLMAICVSKIKVLLFRWIGLFVCPLSGQIQLFRIEKYSYTVAVQLYFACMCDHDYRHEQVCTMGRQT